MIALGLCNIFGSFFQSMPTSGSFSRSAVNEASDVKTPFSGIYVGIILVIALNLLTPYFCFIPTAAMGTILIMSSVFMVTILLIGIAHPYYQKICSQDCIQPESWVQFFESG